MKCRCALQAITLIHMHITFVLQIYSLLTLTLLEPKSCLQPVYRARPLACISAQSDQALYCCLTIFGFHIGIPKYNNRNIPKMEDGIFHLRYRYSAGYKG